MSNPNDPYNFTGEGGMIAPSNRAGEVFIVGSVVYLKIGSPPMVVSGPARCDGLVDAQWFSGGDLKRDTFDPDNLMLERPEMLHMRLQRANVVRFREASESETISVTPGDDYDFASPQEAIDTAENMSGITPELRGVR